MELAKFLDLTVLDGEDKGHQFSVENNSYRVIGRADSDLSLSDSLLIDAHRALNPDQQECVRAQISQQSARLESCKRGSDILVHDSKMSRTHGAVFMIQDKASFTDLFSEAGSSVNASKVENASLSDSDILQMGGTNFHIQIG